MRSQRVARNTTKVAGRNLLQAIPAAAIGLLLVTALPLLAQESKDSGAAGPGKNGLSVGFVASEEASAKEVGLPVYPGARPHKDKSNDNPAFQLGLWGKTWGFKLVGMKLESNDAPEKIAAFYQKAMRKYGKVWNCSDINKEASTQEKAAPPDWPDCQDERPERGETVLEAGTREKRHIVDIKPEGGLSIIQILYVETPPSDGKN